MERSPFFKLAQSVLDLGRFLEELKGLAESCGVPSPEHEYWYDLLKQKLIPQLSEQAFLIVAVMGGTNTGKSLVFNHLVGGRSSAVDHRASRTKHPVCVVPVSSEPASGDSSFESFLARHFESFKLVPWTDPEQPLEESEQHRLFWTESRTVPARLLLLDTPDIDSDREVNWERARQVRNAADVLIAVLTQQKYNDAAVRRFFREAGEADKPIIVLFNMFDFGEDAAHLPRWIERFCEETQTQPLSVLAAPYDKAAADRLELSFHALGDDGTFGDPVDFEKVLTELHFETIKSQTLRGALNVLDAPETGVRSYLATVESASRRFSEALNLLENIGGAAIEWPGLPATILVEEIRTWWDAGRPAWSRNINHVYRQVGNGLLWPIRKAAHYVSQHYSGSSESVSEPLEEFRTAENRAVVQFVGQVIGQLEKLTETDNPVLRRELLELIGGEHRAELLERAHAVLASLQPVDDEFRRTLRNRLTDWSEKNPQAVGWIRSLDYVATVARPVITVTLVLGGGLLGAQVLGLGNMAAEAAVAGGVTAGGEAVVHAGSEGAKRSSARLFHGIQEDYVIARSKRFYAEFQKELWKDVIDRLRTGAAVAESDVFLQCKNWRPQESD